MKAADSTNTRNWWLVNQKIIALSVEKNFGSKLSPYSEVLLKELLTLSESSLQYAKGNEYEK